MPAEEAEGCVRQLGGLSRGWLVGATQIGIRRIGGCFPLATPPGATRPSSKGSMARNTRYRFSTGSTDWTRVATLVVRNDHPSAIGVLIDSMRTYSAFHKGESVFRQCCGELPHRDVPQCINQTGRTWSQRHHDSRRLVDRDLFALGFQILNGHARRVIVRIPGALGGSPPE